MSRSQATSAPPRQSFVDSARVHVRAGRGGRGASSFRREPYVPRGGPDGGDGGRGGSVLVIADRSVASLAEFARRRTWHAENGTAGAGGRKHGSRGADIELRVPVGTQVIDAAGGDVLGDLDVPDATLVVAKGGAGGRGNARFATPANQAPRLAEPGLPGEERGLQLELKLIADVGLVGQPNAGKSSLLASLSAANPKVGDYPFTTLEPELGVMEGEGGRLVLADIPGLIEGASTGAGLGIRFLRHVERTRALAFVVDASAADPWGDLDAVRAEVASYSAQLASRPALTVMNKLDLEPARRLRDTDPRDAVFVSALSGEGLDELQQALIALASTAPAPSSPEVVTRLPAGRARAVAPTVLRQAWGFDVRGEAVERLLQRTDFDSAEGLERFQGRLRRLGVDRALVEAGVQPGDTVRIGELEFEYQP
ncbi:MAG TPA: GTPase ObgE [Candidatus Dormibacteraeota bacterium]